MAIFIPNYPNSGKAGLGLACWPCLAEAGGHYNHELFWKSLKAPAGNNAPSGKLAAAITKDFGSLEAFKNQFNETAKARLYL